MLRQQVELAREFCIWTGEYRLVLFASLVIRALYECNILVFSNEYYGGLWATFNFDGLQKWMEDLKSSKNDSRDFTPDLEDGEKFLAASNQYSTVENIDEEWFIPP